MKYYHLTAAQLASHRNALEAAFIASTPGNNLSVNIQHGGSEAVVKAPFVGGIDAIAVYDAPPTEMVKTLAWTGPQTL